jgi:hypothetical protein
MPLYTLDICTTLSLIMSELLPFCTFIQANGLLHGLLLCLGSPFTRMCFSNQKTNPDNTAIARLKTQEEDEKPYSPRPDADTLLHRYAKTLSNQGPPSCLFGMRGGLPLTRSLFTPCGDVNFREGRNPGLCFDGGGYGTLKRRDYLQPSHLVRADYSLCNPFKFLLPPLTPNHGNQRRGAKRLTCRVQTKSSCIRYLLGIHPIHSTAANVPRPLFIRAIKT